jgi:hypothetical protein
MPIEIDLMPQKDLIVSLYKEGLSADKISRIIGVSNTTIYKFLKVHNVPIRSLAEANRKYSLDDDYFKNLNHESAYWLGFLAADGCVYGNKIILELARKDYEHLLKFKKALKSENPLSKVIKDDKYESYRISLSSKTMVDDLNTLGVTERKSSTLTAPEIGALLSSYYLGYFDGNGYMGSVKPGENVIYRCMVISSIPFSQQFGNWLTTNIRCRYFYQKRKDMQTTIMSTRGSVQFLTHCYSLSPVRLERKWLVFCELINKLCMSKKSSVARVLGKDFIDMAKALVDNG